VPQVRVPVLGANLGERISTSLLFPFAGRSLGQVGPPLPFDFLVAA